METNRSSAHRYVKAFVRRPGISRVITRAARPWASRLPSAVLDRIPPVGRFDVSLPGSNVVLRLESGAGDTQAAGAIWHGIGAAEPETYRWLSALAARSRVFLDVGANVGLYTLALAATRPDLTVVAFEPVPRVFEALRRNVALNGLSNVRLSAAAVSDRTGTQPLFVPAGGVPVEATLLSGLRANTSRIEVPTVTIDRAVEQYGLPGVDLVKVDVEGCELAVLRGTAATIAAHTPTFVCEILHGVGTGAEIALHMSALGYRFFALTAQGGRHDPNLVGDPTFRELNYLLVHERRLPSVAEVLPLTYPNG